MGSIVFPEEKIAKLILKKHKLKTPFDLKKLTGEYAELQYKSIPVEGVDGLSLNIKIIGKKPIVIINEDISKTRQLFTLAHELGHLIIPWHCGINLEETYLNPGVAEWDYRDMEQEANRFAAELLMPEEFIKKLSSSAGSLAELHQEVCRLIGVSEHAAAIRLCQILPRNIMFIAFADNEIKYHGLSIGSFIKLPISYPFIPSDIYPDAQEYSKFSNKGYTFHWWNVGERDMDYTEIDNRTWREILNEILEWYPDALQFKRSLSGKIGSVNSTLQRDGNVSAERLYSACYNRLLHDEDMSLLTKHKDFHLVLSKRVAELISNAQNKNH